MFYDLYAWYLGENININADLDLCIHFLIKLYVYVTSFCLFFFNYSLLARKTKRLNQIQILTKSFYVFCKYLNKRVIPPPPPGITWNIKTLNDFINPFLLIFLSLFRVYFFLNIINLKEILPYLNNHVHLINMCYKMIFFTILCWQQHPIFAFSFTYWHLLHNVIIGVDIYMYRCILTYSKIKEVSMSFHQG